MLTVHAFVIKIQIKKKNKRIIWSKFPYLGKKGKNVIINIIEIKNIKMLKISYKKSHLLLEKETESFFLGKRQIKNYLKS